MRVPKRITVRWLKAHGACVGAIDLFGLQYPKGEDTLALLRKVKSLNGSWVEWFASLFSHWYCAYGCKEAYCRKESKKFRAFIREQLEGKEDQ